MKLEISRSTLALPELLTPTSYWLGHLPFAFWLIENFRPKTFIELGVHTGASYCAFCQAVKALNVSTKCYGIDSFVGDAHYGSYSNEVLQNLLAYHQPRYIAFSTIIQAEFSKALDNFDAGSIDLLHIDGTHFYDDVKADFLAWLPKMSPNGIVLFHDTNVHSMDFGVHRFWAELMETYTGFEFFHGNGLGVLFLGDQYSENVRQLIDSTEDEKNTLRELFYTLGARCQEKAISEVSQIEGQRLTSDLAYRDHENSTLREELVSCNKDRDWLSGLKQSAEQESEESRSSINSLLAILSGSQAELAASGSIFRSNHLSGYALNIRHQLKSWYHRFGKLVGRDDLFAHTAKGSWLTASFILKHIRRRHILKPLAKVQFVNQVKGIAETGDSLLFQDPEAAANRYLCASQEVYQYLAGQRKTWWKRLFIRGRWLHVLRETIQYAESHTAAGTSAIETSANGALSPLSLSRIETKYPGITVPRAIANARSLKSRMRTPKISWSDDGGRSRMNFLFPDLDADIVFGGYIAALEFAAAMGARSDIRLVTTYHPMHSKDALMQKFKSNPRIHDMLAAAEIAELSENDVLSVSPRDFFCSYSVWDGILAHNLARVCGQSEFISFCQEDESSFHAHDYCHATARYSQSLPQFAVFNTTILQDYFRKNRLGVYRDGEAIGDSRSVSFQHALVPTKPASPEDYASRAIKRLLVYARPEDHAKRNLFEFALLAIDQFLKNERIGVHEIELVGVGTLEFQSNLPIGNGHQLKVQPKLELGDYASSLASFDIGLSLMYAPHPSILPFEMAAAGLVVVTNTFGARDAGVLTGISRNIVPVEPSIGAIAQGLAEAWKRCGNHHERIENASFDWSRDWQESFSGPFIDRLDQAAREILSIRQAPTV